MHALNLDPVLLMTNGRSLAELGCREVTLARPIILNVMGSFPPCLFVLKADQTWRTVTDVIFLTDELERPDVSATAIIAARFPGVTFHERMPDGTVRTIVDCRPPSAKPVPAMPLPPRVEIDERPEAAMPEVPFPMPGDDEGPSAESFLEALGVELPEGGVSIVPEPSPITVEISDDTGSEVPF